MGTPVWQILAKLDRIHDLQAKMAPDSSGMFFGGTTFEDEEPIVNSHGGGLDQCTSKVSDKRAVALRHGPAPTNAQVVAATADAAETMSVQRVPVNVYEARCALVIVAPLPAVTADDVTIDLENGSLRFRAALRSAAPRPYLVHEWEYGGCEGIVALPDGFGSAVEANLANGQLVVRVMRGQLAEPVSIHPSTPRRWSSTSNERNSKATPAAS